MQVREMNIRNKNHFRIDYDITRACNNRCPYCCENSYLDNSLKFNPYVFEQVINAVNSYDVPGKLSVSLLGGDPLLQPHHVKEFVERIDADVTVFSNLNYSPQSKHIQLVKDLKCKFINSWHDVSNVEFVKENLLIMKGKVQPILMIRPENINDMLKHSHWLIDSNIKYGVQFIRDELDTVQMDISDVRVQEIFENAQKTTENTIDDETFNAVESLRADLLNIATRHKVLCRLYQCRIKFDGNIETLCTNSVDYGHIKDGLKFKEIMCSGNHCLCDTSNYKRILV